VIEVGGQFCDTGNNVWLLAGWTIGVSMVETRVEKLHVKRVGEGGLSGERPEPQFILA
jgi:hypothetical protein